MTSSGIRCILVLGLALLASGRAMALSCLSTDARVPVFYRTDLPTGKPTMSTFWSMLEPIGRTNTAGMFYAARPVAGACPTGSSPILVLYNTVKDEFFYTASTTVRDARKAAGWTEQTPLAACIANTEDGTDEDYTQQACDMPLFRDEYTATVAAPTPNKFYRTSIRDHHDCTTDTSCSGTAIGRVYPPPTRYAMRTYDEPYVTRTGGTTIKKLVDGHNEVTNPAIPLPFPFTFFGQVQTQVKVSTNGILTFNPATDDATDATPTNTRLIADGPPRNLIAGWWTESTWSDSYNPDKDTSYLYTVETEPHAKRLVVQWGFRTWAPVGGDIAHLTGILREMQIHLVHPDPGMGPDRIEIHYGDYISPPSPRLTEQATIGIMAPYLADYASGSQIGPQCSPTCSQPSAGGDWKPNQVIAFVPQPSGYLVTESLSSGSFQPLDYNEVDKLTTKRSDSVWVDLGFSFEYDGQKFTRVGVSTAGVLMFGQLPPSGPGGTRPAIPPVRGTGSNVIAPWWDDLEVDTGAVIGGIGMLARHLDSGLPDGKQVTIEWRGLVHHGAVPPDTSHRQMQVTLFEANSQISVHYGDSGWTPGHKTLDHPTVGLIGAEPIGPGTLSSGVGYRLVNCEGDCSEVQRDRLYPLVSGDRPSGWPRFAKFVFTADTVPPIDWHAIYRNYFMADDFAGGTPSKGYCGNCHAELHVPEHLLYDAFFNKFENPTEHATDCNTDHAPPGPPGDGPLLLLKPGTRVVDPVNSPLVDARHTPISWMTEPAGSFNNGSSHMPWFTWCSSKQRDGWDWEATFNPVNVLDQGKSRIRRWMLQGAP